MMEWAKMDGLGRKLWPKAKETLGSIGRDWAGEKGGRSGSPAKKNHLEPDQARDERQRVSDDQGDKGRKKMP